MQSTPQPEELETPDAADGTVSEAERLSGQYLTFRLGNESYGLDILHVLEIIRPPDITRVPHASGAVRGVVNLRGKVLPVVDPRVGFELGRVEHTDQTVIIVVHCPAGDQMATVGLMVDEVLEVVAVKSTEVEPPPMGSEGSAGAIQAIARVNDHHLLLLDINLTMSVLAGLAFDS